MLGSSVSLPPVFEPVGDLGGGETGGFGQFALLARRRVRIVAVPIAQHRSRFLFETVARLFAVPDRPRQRELSSHAVLSHSAQRSSAQLLRLDVMRFEPQGLIYQSIL